MYLKNLTSDAAQMNSLRVYDEVKAMEVSPFFWYVPPNSSDETFSLEHRLRIIVQAIETEQGWFFSGFKLFAKVSLGFHQYTFSDRAAFTSWVFWCAKMSPSNFSASFIIPFSSTMITVAGLTQTIRRRVDDSDCSYLWQEAITVSLKVDSFEFRCYQFSPDTWFSASLISKSIHCVIKSGFTRIFLLSILLLINEFHLMLMDLYQSWRTLYICKYWKRGSCFK